MSAVHPSVVIDTFETVDKSTARDPVIWFHACHKLKETASFHDGEGGEGRGGAVCSRLQHSALCAAGFLQVYSKTNWWCDQWSFTIMNTITIISISLYFG